jgi:hypothetical protein
MRTYENDCVGCDTSAYPCIGNACPRRNVLHIRCDKCGCEDDRMYLVGGEDICGECLIDYLVDKEIIEKINYYEEDMKG